jgi:uncharacterized iron-regulated membrane protein
VDWADRHLRTVTPPAPGAAPLGLDALLARVRETRPDARPTLVSVRSSPGASVTLGFGRDDALFANPYTGEIIGPGSRTHSAMRVIEEWHRWLGGRDVGRPVTGVANAVFVVLVVTGCVLWWPRAWSRRAVGAVTLFRSGLRGRARDVNWHNVAGFWCAPVLLILSLTGLVMSYQWANDLLFRLAGSEPPPAPVAPAAQGRGPRGEERGGRHGPAGQPIRLDPLLARAREHAPAGWVSISLRMAPRPDGPVTALIAGPPSWHPSPRSIVTLDPVRAAVIAWEPYETQSLGRRLRAWVRVAHTGEALRLPGQVVALGGSLGAVMLAWTGLALAWRRWRAWAAREQRAIDVPAAVPPGREPG